MDKYTAAWIGGSRLPILESGKLFFLMAHAAGFCIDLLGRDFVMAVGAGFVRDLLEALARCAVAVGTIHAVLRYMEIMAEAQGVFFLVASGHEQYGRTDQQIIDYAIYFHSRTSKDVRTL